MLDPRTPLAMETPTAIRNDAVATEDRRDELGHAAIATVRQDTPVVATPRLDFGPPVVDRVVAIARPAGHNRHDVKVGSSHEDLCVGGPAVVLRLRGMRVVARRDQRTVDDP
jgi:hypothetical protein